MRYVSWQELGIQFDLGAPEATGVLLATLPSTFFASGAQVLGQQVLTTEVVSGELISLLSYAASDLSSLLLGLLCVWITARLCSRAKTSSSDGKTGVQPDDAAGSSSSFSISRAISSSPPGLNPTRCQRTRPWRSTR